jgi:hypothetical protein
MIDMVFVILLTVALFWFLNRTDIGKSIRAVAQDKEAALLMGVNSEKITFITFGMGAALVAAAGTLLIPVYYLFPDIGGEFTRRAFVITILGGLGWGQYSEGSRWGLRRPSARLMLEWSLRILSDWLFSFSYCCFYREALRGF